MAEGQAKGPADVLLEGGRAATLERFRVFGIWSITVIEQVERRLLSRVPRKEGACFTL
jgi:hypothetical protein